jgi:hypothetical protein
MLKNILKLSGPNCSSSVDAATTKTRRQVSICCATFLANGMARSREWSTHGYRVGLFFTFSWSSHRTTCTPQGTNFCESGPLMGPACTHHWVGKLFFFLDFDGFQCWYARDDGCLLGKCSVSVHVLAIPWPSDPKEPILERKISPCSSSSRNQRITDFLSAPRRTAACRILNPIFPLLYPL